MERKPIRGSVEEGGRSQLNEHAWTRSRSEGRRRGPQDASWIRDRELEIREKARRGEHLTHSERMSLAIDEGVQ